MKKQFQSKSVPRGTRTLWRYLGALFLLFTFAIGNVMAEGTTAKVIATGDQYFSAYTEAKTNLSSNNWVSTSGGPGNSGSSYTAPSGWLDGGSGKPGYGMMNVQSGKTVIFTVTNITGVSILGCSNNTSSRTINLSVKTGGVEVGTVATKTTSSTSTPEVLTYGSTLDKTKTYTVTVSASSGNNAKFMQIKFVGAAESAVCPETLTISSKDSKTAFSEGDAIELTAALAKGNGDISYQWYKGGTAEGNKLTGKNTNKLQIASCTTADEGSYYCVASKTSCDDAVNTSGFAITVEADTKCFNMPEITSKPSDLAHVTVSGGTLSDVSTAKSVAMNANGLKLDGNNVYLKVTLASASIVEGTKITVAWKGASSGAGLALVNENLASQVINETNVASAGSVSHTFTAEEAANYADEFILHRNGSGQGIYVNAITVEDCGPAVTKHTVTLNYNDGETPAGSLKVVDGNAAVKPADPTRGKYTFLGWFVGDTDNEYVWSTAVTGDITLKAHWQDPWTITFNSDGGSEVASITVKHNTKAEKPADPTKASHDFNGWYIGDTETQFDWDANVTQDYALKAHWLELVAKYDIEYYDGETKIGTEEQVRVDQHPTAAGISTDKPLYSFVGWYTSSTLEGDPVNLNTVTPVEGLKLYGKWNKVYATSIDFEDFIDDQGTSGDWATYLSNHGYAISSTSDVSLDGGDSGNKPADKGLKIKKANRTITFEVVADKVVVLKVGSLKGGAQIKVNEGEYADLTGASPLSTGASVFSYYYSANVATYTIKTTADDYNIIQSITIRDPYQVTFDANGGEDVASLNGTPSVTLPSATKGTDSFLGWFIGEDKIGEAGDSYTPTANVELVAHWEAVSTDARLASISFSSDAGTLSPAFDPEVTAYTYTMPYKTAAIPTITGATSVNANAKAPVIDSQAANWGDVAHIHGVAQSDDTKDYYITMLQAPKDGVEIIGVVTTGGNNKTVSGLYKGDATVNLDGDKKIGGGKYIYVTLASGYTFEETDVLVVDVKAKSDLPSSPALEITTGVGNIDGSVWKSIANADYELNLVTIPLTGIAEGQTSIGLKRSDHQNTWVNGLKVYRPMMPEMTAITINGEDAVKGTGNTFTITLPDEGTDLAALTVVPTIIRNAPHATTPEAVISNSGAWAEGANTYRVMDKDGDYIDYTITITLQGEAPAPVIATQPAGVAYCAGSEPTLEVVATGDELHYAWFKEAGETDEAVGSDQASYTVEVAGTYYVIVTNHVDGKLDKSVTSENAIVTMNAAAAITTQPTNKRDVVAGSEVTLSVVATNATGYQWYSCDDAEKHGAAAISGAEAANYVFTCNANGFYYCVVGNACGDDITSNVVSVKLEPEGCNTFASKPAAAPYNYEQTGEWTFYNVDSNGADKSTDNVFDDGKNFDDEDVVVANTRRFALKFEKDVESVTLYGVGGNDKSFTKVSVSDEMKKNTYTELTATATKTDLTSQQHIFTIEDMIIPAGKYAWFELSGSLKFFKICYTAALVEPKLPTLSDQELCAGAAYQEFDATITNEDACTGTVSYQWYNAANDEAIEGANVATFTPTAEGTYYVVVTHAKAGHITRTAQSANLSVAHFDALTLVSHSEDVFQHMGTAATLSVVATGKNVAYVWYTCSNAAGDDAVAIDPAETEASLTIASILEGVRYYKVVISHDCDAMTLSHVFKVEGWDQLEQVDVTESTVWDMNNVSASEINLASFEPTKQNVLLLLANIEGVNNNASFNSQALMFEGQRIGHTENNVKYVSGQYVQFNVTVPGMVSVTFASNGSAQRTILINGKQCSRTTNDGTYIKYDVAVEPGSVEIEDVQGYVRISKIEFKAEASHTRPGLNPSFLGTLCWTNNAILGGATLYEFAGKDEYNKLVFDEVAENRLEAGKPYIFMPENGNTEIKLYNTDDAEPLTTNQAHVNHMYGTIVDTDLYPTTDVNMYYFSSNHIWAVKDFTGVDKITIPAFYCYVDYPAVLAATTPAPAPAPGRRRVTMGVQGEQVVTGVENLNASEQPVKLLINGQIFILRGEKMYDATGRLVK